MTQQMKCPECDAWSNDDDWQYVEDAFGCDDCGTHAGIKCPACGEVFDDVWFNPIRRDVQ